MIAPDEAHDPWLQKMRAAWEGDARTWLAVNERLRDAIVDHAARHCGYHRRTVARANREFERIPILTRSIVRERFEALLADDVPARRLVRRATSGSTGEPITFFRDRSQGPIEEGSAQRFLRWLHGVPERAVKVWITAYPEDEKAHPVSTIGLTPRAVAEQLDVWSTFSVYFVYGNASAIDWIASLIEERGFALRRPERVITTSDMLTRPAAERIVRVFGCPVTSWYGSHEFNGFLAGTVPGSERYAFNPLLAYVEVLNDDGRPVPPGETGRLVVTDLNNYVFPLIRYDTGDLATASHDHSIGGWRLVERIDGRSSETLRLPGDRVLSPVTLGQVLFYRGDLAHKVRSFQCAQVRPDALELRIVWGGAASPADREGLRDGLRSAVGHETEVIVVDADRPDLLPSGKAWIVRSDVVDVAAHAAGTVATPDDAIARSRTHG